MIGFTPRTIGLKTTKSAKFKFTHDREVQGLGFRVQQLLFEQSLVELVTLVSEIIQPTRRFPQHIRNRFTSSNL